MTCGSYRNHSGVTRRCPLRGTYRRFAPLDPETGSEFISLIARLSYLAMQTRPDILFAVITLAQFQGEPRM